jgi:formylglycine-generating enzyme required for sulfatase activity
MTISYPCPFGKYVLFRELGRGGFATVYLAHDEANARDVALKVLDSQLARDEVFRQRFEQEFHLAARLEHPHIVPVYELGEADGLLYLAMQLIPGYDLRARLRESGALAAPTAVQIAAEIAAALDHAHAHGMVHRDVKAANILLDAEGNAWLSDFGLVRAAEGTIAGATLTGTAGVLGTPEYLSPEQVAGGQATPLSDLYALGVVVYEMLTGRVPFRADTPLAVLRMQADSLPPDPLSLRNDLPPGLAAEVLRALAKRPPDRHTSAGAFAAALQVALDAGQQAVDEARHRLLQMRESVAAQVRARIQAAQTQAAESERARRVAEAQAGQIEALAAETEALLEALKAEEEQSRQAAQAAEKARQAAEQRAGAAQSRLSGVEHTLQRLEGGAGAAGDDVVLTLAPGVTLEMVIIPAGKFLYGEDKQKVDLPEYRLGRTPVTNAQYKAFVDATGHRRPNHWKNGAIPKGKENHPVVNVSWGDAQAFCKWASQVTGQAMRLPSEQEWEKGARGTDGREYPWGSQAPDQQRCNFNNNVKDTTPVGKYSPAGDSPYGCADIAGNVWEWCDSWYDGERNRRVLRGGAFDDYEYSIRCAYRGYNHPNDRDWNLGFRVCAAPI